MHDQKVSRVSHSWVQDRLSEYLDDRLSPLEKVQIERHLQTCQQCQRELDSLRWTVSLVRAAPNPKLPRQFTLPVTHAPARAPLFGLAALRLATAVATLVLVSLIGIDLIMHFGGGTASSPAAPLSSAQLAAPTRAALAIATPADQRKDNVAGAAQPNQLASVTPSEPLATPRPTSAPRSALTSSAASAVAPAATAVPLPSLTPTPLAPAAFSGPATSASKSSLPTPTSNPTATIRGLGAGPLPPLTSESSTQTSEASAVPTEEPTTEPSASTEPPAVVPPVAPPQPPATQTLSAQAYIPPTAAPQATTVVPDQGEPAISPLRIAELAALFAAVFLGTILVLLRLRQ